MESEWIKREKRNKSKVSWCSWLSHHLDVVRVPGSNPGGTIVFMHKEERNPIIFLRLKVRRVRKQ